MCGIEIRRKFLQMEEEDLVFLRKFKPTLEPKIDQILSDFYSHISSFDQISRIFQSPERIKHAASMQKKHWLDFVFAGIFDQRYMQKVTEIGKIHQRIGLEPRWYMAGYCIALNQITALAIRTYRRRPEIATRLVNTIHKVVFLDMDLATSVYIEQNLEATAHAVTQALEQKADLFERDVKGIVAEVSNAADTMKNSAQHLANNTRDTSMKSVAVAAAAEQAAMNIHAVTAAAEELTLSITEISCQIQRSNMVTDAMHVDMGETNKRVSSLSESTTKIGQIVNLIQAIARQTNMLALNATIEAARAGESGKGFVVVANEVKSLATKTARATEEISRHVMEVQAATDETVNSITGISRTIDQIKDISESIAAAVEEQGAATQEIARNIQQASTGTQEVSQTISQVSTAANENGEVADGVSGSASTLSHAAGRLEVQLDRFVKEIRTG
ncbi:globin-coupled sensor protein [Magnetospirillum sulfuroxidans]|uniref:Globin-coupled sensor protein n=1 Tax=Magnetospirillum sulfuroxidans TaxID=611300 RepID=A0ABS5I8K0_9PROT|nr:globin-coupled sensor protein [Magnetospirillum sulfuroxidans]MBR9970766.1 globin-coupled sensor protein [Magnetospirillum sulfuroxidans]